MPKKKEVSIAEPRVADNKIDDGVSNVFAKQGETKFDPGHSNGTFAKQGRTEKEMKRSSTYFAHEFKPEAGTVCSSKTKSGPKQLSVEFEKKLTKEEKSSILAKVSNFGSLDLTATTPTTSKQR